MKRQIKKWILQLTATGLVIFALLLVLVLNPVLSYANNTAHDQYTVYHDRDLDAAFLSRLDEATQLLKASEIFSPDLHLDICLNDGSNYPGLIRVVRGRAFAWGFYNKVVLQGVANCKDNYVELNGYRWNLTQLLAHEMIHCMQFNSLGFWKSKPVADIPDWKWEGYAEYVSCRNSDQLDLSANISRLLATDNTRWDVAFADSTIAPRLYYEYWTLVQYCMDIKKMTFHDMLADTTDEGEIRRQMMSWQAGDRK